MGAIRALLVAAVLAGCGGSTAQGEDDPEPTARPTPTTRPLPNDPVARAEALVERQYAGDNNQDQAFLRDVQVAETAEGLVVYVEFNANDNFGNSFIRGGIENEMQETYATLFTDVEGVDQVGISAYFPLIDQLGNESEEVVYATVLDSEVANQINWDNAAILDWSGIWTLSQLHPAIAED